MFTVIVGIWVSGSLLCLPNDTIFDRCFASFIVECGFYKDGVGAVAEEFPSSSLDIQEKIYICLRVLHLFKKQ